MKRRNFLKISALASPLLGTSCEKIKALRKSKPEQFTWRGSLLSSSAEITFQQITKEQAQVLIPALTSEINRLESLFSLSHSSSPISLLNLQGEVLATDLDFLELVNKATTFSHQTDGLFDPTIQSYLSKTRSSYLSGTPLTPLEKDNTLSLVDYRDLDRRGTRFQFRKKGMQLTLDGISKGYITDKIHALLKNAGFSNILINLGEYRALGTREGSKPWKLHLDQSEPNGELKGKILELSDGAVSISCGSEHIFSVSDNAHHLINPIDGKCFPASRTIAIKAPDATTADALSTACAVTTPEKAVAILERFPGSTLLYDTMIS